MLYALSIRDFVLVRQLDLSVGPGFTALTGETGAGKSIILDALSLALGGRTERAKVRTGAQQATIIACFDVRDRPATLSFLNDHGIDLEDDPTIVLKRVIPADGPSRNFLNDQVVSVNLLKALSPLLLEMHGQHDGSLLLQSGLHRALLDQYAGADPLLSEVEKCYEAWQEAQEEYQVLLDQRADQVREREYLESSVEELSKLAPEADEAATLAQSRALLQHGQKYAETLTEAENAMQRANVDDLFVRAGRALQRIAPLIEEGEGDDAGPSRIKGHFQSATASIEQTLIEASEALLSLQELQLCLEFDPAELERIESRLFALKAAARKYAVEASELPVVLADMQAKLENLETIESQVETAELATKVAWEAFERTAMQLHDLRTAAGTQLAQSVESELTPLKLERVRFRVAADLLDETEARPNGLTSVRFEVSTNPGTPFGALNKIASGGELARISLALKVCLAETTGAQTLIFDEVDQGVGGAVAAAIGDRLSDLARSHQVLAITHGPQVAAASQRHWRVSKSMIEDQMISEITVLEGDARQEEIARMLAGSEVTHEARAAAGRLLAS